MASEIKQGETAVGFIDTKELINKLTPETDIDSFFEEYGDEFIKITPKELLNEYLVKYDLRVGAVAKLSGQGEYVYKVFNGERKASRDILICIAVGMKLKLEEAQLLLRVSKFAVLDPRDKRDSVIIFGIKSLYDYDRLNELLIDKGQSEL